MKNSLMNIALKNYMKLFILAAVSLSVSVLTVACSKGDGGGGTPAVVPNPYAQYPAYPTTSAGSAPIALAVGDAGSNPGQPSAELVLQFYGTSSANQYANYQGNISAVGKLYITQTYSNCGVPPGQYTVNTSQFGQMSGSTIQGLMLIATGPTQLQIAITSAGLDGSYGYSRGMDGGSYQTRLSVYSGAMQGVQGYGACPMVFY